MKLPLGQHNLEHLTQSCGPRSTCPATRPGAVVVQSIQRLACALALLLISASIHATAEEFQLSLDSGSVITVEVPQQTINWTNVMDNGDMTKKDIPFSEVKQLLLSKSPASKQVAQIRSYLNMLGSDDYLERELAEEQLSDPKVSGRFKSLIKIRSEESDFEIRYRAERILDRLNNQEELPNNEFDQLTLKDGSVYEGDAGDITIQCDFRGNKSSFKRDALRLISTPMPPPELLAADENIEVRMFHLHEEINEKGATISHFFRDDQVMVDFDNAPNGAGLKRQAQVNDTFTPFGLRLDTAQVGYIGISGYPFKFAPLPVSGNSICVFETIGTYAKRFKGVTEIRFCLPNQAAVPAGVFEVGLFIARVNHSRDFILEAYNADGELLASVESTDKPCVFTGVKANEPITKLRILSNPYLFRVDRAIDEDYGMDSICFSPPVPVATPVDSQPGVVRLKNGDLLKGIGLNADEIEGKESSPDLNRKMFDTIKIVDDNSLSIQVSPTERMTLRLDDVQTIRFANELDGTQGKDKKLKIGSSPQGPNKWMAILKDRSTLLIRPGETPTSTTFNVAIDTRDIAGLKASKNPTRYPEADDFEHGKNVLVFPTCRIASDHLEFSEAGLKWNPTDKKLQQPIHTGVDEDEDPTPNFTEITYAKSSPASTPTVWLAPPKSQMPGTGKLRLTDGQQLTLGGKNGSKITRLDQRSVVVSVAGDETTIPIEKVLSIDFPR